MKNLTLYMLFLLLLFPFSLCAMHTDNAGVEWRYCRSASGTSGA